MASTAATASPPPSTPTTTTTTGSDAVIATYRQIFWCHHCDMSVSLLSSPSASTPPLCPHCHLDFLEHMDSPPLHHHHHHPPLSPFSASSSYASSSDADSDSDDHNLFTSSDPDHSLSLSIPSLPITPDLLAASDDPLLCAVCKDEFVAGTDAKQLPCTHFYHSHCILPWLSLHNSCPLCRFFVFPPSVSPTQLAQLDAGSAAAPANSGETVSSWPPRDGLPASAAGMPPVDEEGDAAMSESTAELIN